MILEVDEMETDLAHIQQNYGNSKKVKAPADQVLDWVLLMAVIAVFAFLIFGFNSTPTGTIPSVPASSDSTLAPQGVVRGCPPALKIHPTPRGASACRCCMG